MLERNKSLALLIVAILLMASITTTLHVILGTHWLGGEKESRTDLNGIGADNKVIASDDHVYVLGDAAVVILDVQDKKNPRELSRIQDLRGFRGWSSLYIDGNWLYIGTDVGSFQVVNITNKTDPEVTGKCGVGGSEIRSIVSDGNYAYLATRGGISIVDIRNKEQPKESGRKGTEFEGYDILVKKDIAFLSDITNGLFVFDVSDKSNPMKIGEYSSVDGEYLDIARYKNTLFCQVTGKCVIALDVSDPTRPSEIRRINEKPHSIGIHGDRLFIYHFYHEKIKVFNINDPKSPKKVGSFKVSTFPVGNFSVDGNYLYIAEDPLLLYELQWKLNPWFWIPVLIGWAITVTVVMKLKKKEVTLRKQKARKP